MESKATMTVAQKSSHFSDFQQFAIKAQSG
ncbi:predicted protein [Sclerotinia sclerotiorum 1980 UF-70]|uniref:Uncharacterized protein n=1 Tax=Sclerotinia sclerotiorum (strain ATCC 18683 / 1980 / Ss-1) TaxID=665079 RepID=A7EW54_SCLS1|nr:predicted protein [Sclerotinia sclerotiorum 1980 UF-70]EDN93696.1 predicted protein [Sclerotinia sclerotiorum 1980 UF-70]